MRISRRASHSEFATEMIDVDTLISTTSDQAVSLVQSVVSEPARSLTVLGDGSERPQLRGVETTISMLDIRDPGYSLRNGYLLDPARRVVYEKKVGGRFGSLRVGMAPLEQAVRIDGTVAWLWSTPNYGHWLLLALPLIEHYRSLLGGDPDYYYLGSPARAYQFESLDMLGISRERVLTRGVTAGRLLVAIADRHGDYDTEFLLFADGHLQPWTRAAVAAQRRLFVSRSGASHRRLVNELECARVLGDTFGFELVSTEGMSLADEIEMFRGAALVVGAHGAGLTNIAFAPSAARVVELASTTYWDSIFAQIASVKGQSYALIRGRSTRGRLGVPASWHDFEIDVEKLVDVVRAALDEAPPPD